MGSNEPSTFEGLCLEDSYFLGMLVAGSILRLRVLFALTVDHPSYSPPKRGEQHSYREGNIEISGLSLSNWRPGSRPNIQFDPDGSLDLGGISAGQKTGEYWINTEWFEMTFSAQIVIATFDTERT